MVFLRTVALSLWCAVSVLSKPLNVPAVVPRQEAAPLTDEQKICGNIIILTRNNYTLFYANEVFKCLQSVPFNDAVATRFINYYNMTLQFQSTTAFLKDPPAGYQQPPVDVQQVLSQIQANVTAGVYKNQYSFEADLQLLVHRMHDSHVTLNAGILDTFSFLSPAGLVSVSADGKQAPEIYLADDLLQSQWQGYQASPITTINGRDIIEYLTEFAELNANGRLEPNADWNSLMDSPPLWISGDLSVVQSTTMYPGDEIDITLKNKTDASTYWLAIYNEVEDTGPLTTGGDFYNYFVLGEVPASYDENNPWWPTLEDDDSSDNSTKAPDPYVANCARGNPSAENWCLESYGAYPNDPVVSQPGLSVIAGGVVTGYIYNDTSTAVLSIPSFYQYDTNIEQFDYAIQYFIGNATQRNVSKVVIDLQTNTGGNVYLAYNTFKQLFYHIDPYAASRIRSHKLADVLGNTYSTWWKELEQDFDGDNELNGEYYNYTAADEWVVGNRINAASGRNFSSWAEYSSQVTVKGDKFSAAQRFNLSDEVFDSAAFDGWIPYGYGIAIDDNATPQVWDPKDIVILTDGACASTCALFVELMSHQAGVRTVAVGGRPSPGPMQAVSGSRGARIYDASELDSNFNFVANTIKDTAATAMLPNRSDTGMWITTAGINIRDQVRANDNEPLQFKYQAADCRIYYTIANVFNMTRLWHDVAAAAFDDVSLCIPGSTGFPSALNSSSSSTPPPPRTAQPAVLDFDLANNVTPENSTLGNDGSMQAGPGRPSGEIKACKSSSECTGTSTCVDTSIRCNGALKTVKACLPSCRSNEQSCPRTSECDYDRQAPSKLNAVSGRKASVDQPFYLGRCRPSGASAFLPCPR
ncbi:hypothetical protein DE146DRAFT_365948 [Phaeosphaeria sp. MPI-PUGE-AT-0046c]|nr:hypothetical protein DE146DRAFT_365948 [Phaeosphaeria sp. MPI-PUGE-AT-0046c]